MSGPVRATTRISSSPRRITKILPLPRSFPRQVDHDRRRSGSVRLQRLVPHAYQPARSATRFSARSHSRPDLMCPMTCSPPAVHPLRPQRCSPGSRRTLEPPYRPSPTSTRSARPGRRRRQGPATASARTPSPATGATSASPHMRGRTCCSLQQRLRAHGFSVHAGRVSSAGPRRSVPLPGRWRRQ